MPSTNSSTNILPNSKPVDTTWSDAELENYKLHRRFDRLGRLVGDLKMQKLMNSHVMVVGLGGVGSWAAEMLVRSGVGKLTLVDFDEVCITNFNRQLHALNGEVGVKKAEALAARFSKINPQAKLIPLVKFYNEDSQNEIFSERPDFVIDAIDSVTPKCMLLAYCHRSQIPVITSTGSAGRMDSTLVQIKDLNRTEMDPLAKAVRRILRQQYGFGEKNLYGIPAIYSDEAPTEPQELKYDGGKGFKCVCPQGENSPFSCDNRNIIMGSSGFVTAAFGMAASSYVVRELIKNVGDAPVAMNVRKQKTQKSS